MVVASNLNALNQSDFEISKQQPSVGCVLFNSVSDWIKSDSNKKFSDEIVTSNIKGNSPVYTSDKAPVPVNVKASDYATPQKYLDNPSSIPSYYSFQSNMVANEDLKPGMIMNLEVDKRLTLPTRTHIKFLITATDVIHSFAVPSLGLKVDATPGRLIKANTFIQREGVFYGQCSELCGTLHNFMPIVIEAVSPEVYAAHAKKYYRED